MSRYQALQARAARQNRPWSAHFELTYHCNVRCRHCFQDREAAPDELDLGGWLRAVDGAREAGVLVVTLSGGEALLSPHFWPVAERVRERGMALRVFTNGVLLSRSACRRLAALHPASVEISLFALDPAVHDAVTRAPGSFSRALRGLLRLRRLGVAVKLKCPLLDRSSRDFHRVRALAERLGCGVVFDPNIFPRFDGEAAPTRCRGDDQILLEYFEVERGLPGGFRRIAPRAPGDPLCGIARTFTVVSPEGKMLSCPLLQSPVGDLRERPLLEIWRTSPELERLRRTGHGDLDRCGSCARSGYCGRCSATALLEDGDFFGPSARACRLAELREQAWGLPPPAAVPVPGHRRLRVLP